MNKLSHVCATISLSHNSRKMLSIFHCSFFHTFFPPFSLSLYFRWTQAGRLCVCVPRAMHRTIAFYYRIIYSRFHSSYVRMCVCVCSVHAVCVRVCVHFFPGRFDATNIGLFAYWLKFNSRLLRARLIVFAQQRFEVWGSDFNRWQWLQMCAHSISPHTPIHSFTQFAESLASNETKKMLLFRFHLWQWRVYRYVPTPLPHIW